MRPVECYKNEKGQIAVLVSIGYGCGWSTCNYIELAYDKRVVEFWLEKKDDKIFMRDVTGYRDNDTKKATKALFSSWGYPDVYFGGFADMEIEWVEPNCPFGISEYDGYESLLTCENSGLITLR